MVRLSHQSNTALGQCNRELQGSTSIVMGVARAPCQCVSLRLNHELGFANFSSNQSMSRHPMVSRIDKVVLDYTFSPIMHCAIVYFMSDQQNSAPASIVSVPNRKQTPRPWKKLQAEAHIIHIHELSIDAINARDFDPKAKAWQHWADVIEMQIDIPHTGVHCKHLPLHEYLEVTRAGIEDRIPGLRCRSRK